MAASGLNVIAGIWLSVAPLVLAIASATASDEGMTAERRGLRA